MNALLALMRSWPPLASLAFALAMWATGTVIAVPVALVVAQHETANTPPPPYTSGEANLATANALGGVASALACTEQVGSQKDLLKNASWSNATCTTTALTASAAVQSRIVTAKLMVAPSANARVCISPSSTAPSVSCVDANAIGDGYGCSLVNVGDVCQWTIRPQTSGCTTWDTCHLPIWAVTSTSGGSPLVEVSVTQ